MQTDTIHFPPLIRTQTKESKTTHRLNTMYRDMHTIKHRPKKECMKQSHNSKLHAKSLKFLGVRVEGSNRP